MTPYFVLLIPILNDHAGCRRLISGTDIDGVLGAVRWVRALAVPTIQALFPSSLSLFHIIARTLYFIVYTVYNAHSVMATTNKQADCEAGPSTSTAKAAATKAEAVLTRSQFLDLAGIKQYPSSLGYERRYRRQDIAKHEQGIESAVGVLKWEYNGDTCELPPRSTSAILENAVG